MTTAGLLIEPLDGKTSYLVSSAAILLGCVVLGAPCFSCIEGFSMGKVTVLDGGFNGKMPMWKITRGYT